MPPNTLRVHTEYVLVKSVGLKVLWEVAAETTGAEGWGIFPSTPVPCLNCGGGGARVQRNSSTMMRVWEQWTDEHRITRKTGNRRRKVTSARDDRHLLCMAVNESTASSRQLAARWSTATGVLMSASSLR
ncbi:transposable element Tcb2 transposase [Trichonephila clavipes]|uniref:Transposable element Tcb2 transposase n=1 Tax=Trichonephila clavipes TaxID=2585209 RepID=A0A8X6R4E4_TRICX|nr:transposable element Tcb2 transposase [Trichonephila clavipes]